MQRRYPGRQPDRGGPSNWQARNERAYWGAGERDAPNYDESLLPDDEYESAYRLAGEDTRPDDWGREWGDWDDRASPEHERRRRGGGRRGVEGRQSQQQAYGAQQRGYGEPDRRQDERYGDYGDHGERGERGEHGEHAPMRGHQRFGGYGSYGAYGSNGGYRGYGGYGGYGGAQLAGGEARRYGDAPDPSRVRGPGAPHDEPRHRQGPKGYTRSDERIREDVCERLAAAFDIDVSDVSVEVRDGRVELEGTVPARWMKHGIEDIADSCMCVRDVENRVRVRRDNETSPGQVLRPDQRTVTPTPQSVREAAADEPGDDEPRH